MKTTYGPEDWNPRECAEEAIENLDLDNMIEDGRRKWTELNNYPHADTFWDVIAPMVYALAAEPDAGYEPNFSTATACEQLMHEIAIIQERSKTPWVT